MDPIKPQDKMLALRHDFAARRREILRLAPEMALERVLDFPQSAALVHTFPEEDLHILIREIGPEDALPLIALASQKQLDYLLDQEIWHNDRIDIPATAIWLDRLLRAEAASHRMLRWLTESKTDLLELFLYRSIEVQIREHDQDPSVFGPDFFTYDDVFYVRIITPPKDIASADAADTETRQPDMVKRLLDDLAEYDYPRFQAILLEAAHLLPAETEEEAYRLRNGRLAERGFLPFDEAIGLYQPISDLSQPPTFRHKVLAPEQPDGFPVVPAAALSQGNLFAQALATIDSSEQRQALQEEFAALCNRIIVADRKTIHRREDLAAVVNKASGYLNLGLQNLLPRRATSPEDVAAGARALRRHHLEGIFRRGYNEAVHLKQAAEKWVQAGWFAARGLPLTFWGETWLGVIGGLLIKRPLFFDNYQSGTLYRDFADMKDIEWTRRQFEQVQAFDHLLDRLDLSLPAPGEMGFLTYKNLLLTIWSRRRLALPEEVRPLTTASFRPFFRELFQRDGTLPPETPGQIDGALKEDFLHWLADRSKTPATDLAASIGPSLESLFAELEVHYGRVSPDHIDPRYIHHFLLVPRGTQPK